MGGNHPLMVVLSVILFKAVQRGACLDLEFSFRILEFGFLSPQSTFRNPQSEREVIMNLIDIIVKNSRIYPGIS